MERSAVTSVQAASPRLLPPAADRSIGAASEPAYLAGPPLFWRLLAANLLVVLGGAVVGTTLTRQFVMRGAFTPLTHALMVVAAIALSALLTAVILHLAFRPLRSLRLAIERGDASPARVAPARDAWLGDPDILAVADAVQRLWDRLDQQVQMLEDGNRHLEAQRAELAEKTVQLERLASRVLAAEEEERRRIARELHDDTMQSLAALIMGLERSIEQIPDRAAAGPALEEARLSMVRLRDLASRMLDDLRHLALDLRPAVLDDHGLPAALGWLAQTQSERTAARIVFETDPALLRPGAARLPAAAETALYRIVQEALSNVAKHSGASEAHVRFRLSPSAVAVEVEDSGRGFVPGAERDPGQMGLVNMRERAGLLGGTLDVRSGPEGTLVRARIPLTGHSSPRAALSAGTAA